MLRAFTINYMSLNSKKAVRNHRNGINPSLDQKPRKLWVITRRLLTNAHL